MEMLASSCVINGVRKQSGAATVDDCGNDTDSVVQAMLSLTPPGLASVGTNSAREQECPVNHPVSTDHLSLKHTHCDENMIVSV